MNEQEPLSADGEMSEDIAELLERRSTYREWLNRLEEMKDEVSPEVYRPVEEDYRVRLGRVDEELSRHREGLQRELQERQSRHSELTARRDELVRELNEGELRHRVGELREDEWEEYREERREEITELDRSLEEERVAVEEIREILRSMEGEPPAAGEPAGGEYVEDEWERRDTDFEEGEVWWEAPATEGREESAAVDEPEERELQLEDEAEGISGDREEEWELSEAVEEEKRPEPGDEAAWDQEAAATTAEEEAPEAEAPEDEALEAPEEEALEEEDAGEEEAGEEEYYDELEFLESLSLDDTERFDAVSSMLDEEEDEEEGNEEDEDR